MDPRGAAAAAVTAVLYGTSYVATAVALRSFTPLGAAALRGALGAVALGLLLSVSRSPALRPRRISLASAARLVVLAILSGPAFIIAMNVAVALAGASITAFVAGLYAVLAAVLAVPMLGERPERLTLASLLLALVGAALLGELHLGGDQGLGVAVALGAAVVFAAFLVLSRRWAGPWGLPGPAIGAVALGLSAVVASILLPFGGGATNGAPLQAGALVALLWLALGPGALAIVLVVISMQRLPARRASVFLLLNPPTAAIGSWILLGERFTPLQLLGAALILLAMGAATGAAGAWRPRRPG